MYSQEGGTVANFTPFDHCKKAWNALNGFEPSTEVNLQCYHVSNRPNVSSSLQNIWLNPSLVNTVSIFDTQSQITPRLPEMPVNLNISKLPQKFMFSQSKIEMSSKRKEFYLVPQSVLVTTRGGYVVFVA